MTNNNDNNAKGFLIGFLAGGAVGAIVALLTTPKSGKELRGDIKQKSGEYFDEADKYYQEKKVKAGELLNEGKRKYSMMIDDATIKTKDVLHIGKEKLHT